MHQYDYRNRRSNSSRGVRDCLGQRSVDTAVAAGRPTVGGRLPKAQSTQDLATAGFTAAGKSVASGRPPRAESNLDILRQLPVPRVGYLGNRLPPASADAAPGDRNRQFLDDFGGYRPPVSADPAPRARARGGPVPELRPSETLLSATMLGATIKRERGQQRSASCEEQSAPSAFMPSLVGESRSRAALPHISGEPGRQGRACSDGPRDVARVQSRGGAQSSDASSADRAVGVVSAFVEPNLQFRDHMEDRYVCIDPFMPGELGHDRCAFLAVYDGHGGHEAADHCEAHLHEVLAAELRSALREHRRPSSLGDKAIADALSRTFCKVDDQLRTIGSWHLGSTATVTLVQRSMGGIKIHSANVGDSRAITMDHKNSCRLTQDHRAVDASEVLRVQQAGGFVSRGRVSGVLAVSRALGDHSLKHSGVTWRPHVSVRNSTSDMALVIGSDGLWDSLEDAEVRAIVIKSKVEGSCERIAQRLVEDAQTRGSMDNITCVVAFL